MAKIKKTAPAAGGVIDPPEKVNGIHAENIPHTEIKSEALPAVVVPVELTPEQVATQEVAKFNVARTWIAEKKAAYSGLTIAGIDDKEGIKKVEAAYKEMRDKRLLVDKKHKELKAPFLFVGKSIDTEKNELTELIVEVEDPLGAELDRIEALKKAEKEKEQREAAEKLQGRVVKLIDAGMMFNGSYYAIGDITMDVVTLGALKDDEYTKLFEKVIGVKAAADAEIEAEKERQENERLTQENLRLENEKKAEDLRLQQEALDKERQEMKDAKKAIRVSQLEALGFKKAFNENFTFTVKELDEMLTISAESVELLEDALFKIELSNAQARIKDMNERAAAVENWRVVVERRIDELIALGMVQDGRTTYFSFPGNEPVERIKISADTISNADAELWEKQIVAANETVKRIADYRKEQLDKAERSKQRQALLLSKFQFTPYENDWRRVSNYDGIPKMLVTGVEILNSDPETWDKILGVIEKEYAETLAAEKAAQKAIDDQAEAERVAALSDTQKMQEFVNKISDIFKQKPVIVSKKLAPKFNAFCNSINSTLQAANDSLKSK